MLEACLNLAADQQGLLGGKIGLTAGHHGSCNARTALGLDNSLVY